MDDGAQQRRGQLEREVRERERREMQALGGAGRKSMPPCGNGGSNLRWRRINLHVRPTSHFNIEFLRCYHDSISSPHVSELWYISLALYSNVNLQIIG